MLGTETRFHDFPLTPASDTVLDLRKVKLEPTEHLLPHSPQDVYVPYSPPHHYYYQHAPTSLVMRPLTTDSEDSSDISVGSPPASRITSPTFAITQNVISAASPRSGKPTRPFKAYPKDPLALSSTVGATAAEALLGQASNEAYMEFRQRMLLQVQAVTNNPSSGFKVKSSLSPPGTTSSGGEGEDKDAAYWERRRKNNEAAKRSRDARRAKEDEIAIRAAFLEQENLRLKYEVATLRNEAAKLRYLLVNGKS